MDLTRTQIDKLGERLRHGEVSESDLRLLDAYRRTFASAYDAVIQAIRDELGLEPTGRPAKSTTSVVEKLERESLRLTQMQDIAGCRIVVADTAAQDLTVDQLGRLFPSSHVVDRRLNPSHGYRAVHVVVEQDARLIELQVRTSLQHLWAEFSEKCSDAFGSEIKYGSGNPTIRDILTHQSGLVGKLEAAEHNWMIQRELLTDAGLKLQSIKNKSAREPLESDWNDLQAQLTEVRLKFESIKNEFARGMESAIVSVAELKGEEDVLPD